jgi:uncharacterized protein
MKDSIRALSGRTEFLVVIIGAFGIFIPSNLLALLTPATALPRSGGSVTSSSLTGLICYELVVLAVLGAFLRTRGWTLQKVGFAPSVRDTLAGAALTVGSYAVHAAIAHGAMDLIALLTLSSAAG